VRSRSHLEYFGYKILEFGIQDALIQKVSVGIIRLDSINELNVKLIKLYIITLMIIILVNLSNIIGSLSARRTNMKQTCHNLRCNYPLVNTSLRVSDQLSGKTRSIEQSWKFN